MADKAPYARKNPSRADNLATDGSPPKKRSALGIETSQTADQPTSKRRAAFVAQSKAPHTSSYRSSMGRCDTGDLASAFYQPETAPPTEVLDTNASNLFLSQASQASSWNLLSDPFPPITFPIEREEMGLPAAASLPSGMSAQSTLVQQPFPSDQQTQRRNHFHLEAKNPSDHNTWIVGTHWSPLPRSMVTPAELAKVKDGLPFSSDLEQYLNRKYKSTRERSGASVTTLSRKLLATILDTNWAYKAWNAERQSRSESVRKQKQYQLKTLVKAFFDPGDPPDVPKDSLFRYENIPKPYQTSRNKLETVICKWMHEIAVCSAVEWLVYREQSGPAAVGTTLENYSRCASALPANAFNRDDVRAAPLYQDSIAAGGAHAGHRTSLLPQSSSFAGIVGATNPRAYEEGSQQFWSNDQSSHYWPASTVDQNPLDATAPQLSGIESYFPPYSEGAPGPLAPAAGYLQGRPEMPGSMSTSQVSDYNESLPLVRETTAPAFAEGTYSGSWSSTVPRDAMSGRYSYNPDGNEMSSSQASGHLAPR